MQPLEDLLPSFVDTPGALAWGVYTLAAATNFLNIDCKIVHGQITLSSLFVDKVPPPHIYSPQPSPSGAFLLSRRSVQRQNDRRSAMSFYL